MKVGRIVQTINSHSANAELGCSKNSQKGDLINSISVIIAERLAVLRSEMITVINKNRDKSVSLGDRESYYEGFDATDLQKVGKEKISRSPL